MSAPKWVRVADRVAAIIPLIPERPPCWSTQASWRLYVVNAVEVRKSGHLSPLRIEGNQPAWDLRWSYCTDCTRQHATAMRAQGRCKPDELRRRHLDKPVMEASA